MRYSARVSVPVAIGLCVTIAAATIAIGGAAGGARVQAQEDPPPIYLPLVLKHKVAEFPPIPTVGPTATITPVPSATPSPTITATAGPSLTPTEAPTEVPSPTATSPAPDWLQFVDYHRALARLPGVTENTQWSRGGELHSTYMVKNDVIGHSESSSRPFYTQEGHLAAQNGNVYISSRLDGDYRNAINNWMVGPFHMLGIIDPKLEVSGYGDYAEDIGRFRFGATLDVLRGRTADLAGVRFPVFYPYDGRHIPNLAFDGNESPDPLVACPGYNAPTGPPVALQLGTGDITPSVTATSFEQDGTALPHCTFDETSFPGTLGKRILDGRDAVILMPKAPLKAGLEYTVSIEVNDETYTWSFTAGAPGGGAMDSGAAPLPVPPIATD